MLNYLYNSLTGFRNVFSREKTWLVFVMIVLGFIGSTEMVGVSSFCRFWLLDIPGYHTLNHFFRSSAWTLNGLLNHWFFFVSSQGLCMTSQGRIVILGDHSNLIRDGRKMPGVTTLHQESETQSKPGYFRGQCWGAIATVIGVAPFVFALPLMLQIHQGFQHLGREANKHALTMGERIVDMALSFALKTDNPLVLTLDAFFSTKTVFNRAKTVYSIALQQPLVEIIVRAKKNYVAFFPADPKDYKGSGRYAQYGEKIHLMEIFDYQSYFATVEARIYNKIEMIKLYHLDLIWQPLSAPLRFVFAETSRGRIVLMCSNLSQDPLEAIELYCLRARIETMFDMLKNVIHAFQCHFWSKRMPRHSRKPRRNSELITPQPEDLPTVQRCWDATEGFVNIGAITLGLLQLIATLFSAQIWQQYEGFLKTRSREIPSERTTKNVLAGLLMRDFFNLAPSAIMRKIRTTILKGKIEDKIFQNSNAWAREAA